MSYAFISYKTDDLHEALWVKEKLGEKGVPCWMAPDSIPGGSSYAQEIPKAIRNCFAFILILSEKTLKSTFPSVISFKILSILSFSVSWSNKTSCLPDLFD